MEYLERKFDTKAMTVKTQIISVLDYRYRYALPERDIGPELIVINDEFTPPDRRFIEAKISMPYVRDKRIKDVEQQLESAQNEVSNCQWQIARLKNDVDYYKAALAYEKLPFWSKWAKKLKRTQGDI